MSSFYVKDEYSVLIQDNGEAKKLVQLDDYYSNKSRIPAHNLNDSLMSIPKVQNDLIDATQNIYPDATEKELLRSAVTVSLLISCFMKTSAAFKVAIIGKNDNLMNYNIAEITGLFHPLSKLCLINDGRGDNDDGRTEFTEVLVNSPVISVMYTDYDDIITADGTFDITIINGKTHFSNQYDVINEAIRITKQKGLLICLDEGDYLLGSVFKLIMQEREEYEISHDDTVLTAVKNGDIWSNKEKIVVSDDVLEEMKKDARNAKISGNIGKMREIVFKADKFADEALREHETELKKEFIAVKEEILKSIVKEKKKM